MSTIRSETWWRDIFIVWSNRGFTIQLETLNSAVFLSRLPLRRQIQAPLTWQPRLLKGLMLQLLEWVNVCLQMLIASLPLRPLKWLFPRVKIHTCDNGQSRATFGCLQFTAKFYKKENEFASRLLFIPDLVFFGIFSLLLYFWMRER